MNEAGRQYAMRGVQLWRSPGAKSPVEDLDAAAVSILCYQAQFDSHVGEIASARATMAEGISLAKALNDVHGLAVTLCFAAGLACRECNLVEVERYSSDLIELSTRHRFAYWIAIGTILRGWARSASGNSAEGIPSIEQGIRDLRATGAVLAVPFWLELKAEALYFADRTSEALEVVKEAEVLAERFENRIYYAPLNRLHGVLRRLLVLTTPKLRLRSSQPSESQRSRSRFRWRHAQKQPTRNTVAKKRAGQADMDFDCYFGDSLQRLVFRSTLVVVWLLARSR